MANSFFGLITKEQLQEFYNGIKNKFLHVSSQTLTNEQKSTVRENIGAGTSSFSGEYDDLSNKPNIPTKISQLVNDMGYTDNYNDLSNKPKIPINVSQLLNDMDYTTIQDVTNKLDSLKGSKDGLAELDANGVVPSSQLPSYVDDVLEFSSKDNFPTDGETGKIYVAVDSNLTYRWTGSVYTEISPSIALGETSSTAYRGDRGAVAYEHSQTVGNPHRTTKEDIGLENVDNTADAMKTVRKAAMADRLTKGINIGIGDYNIGNWKGDSDLNFSLDDIGVKNDFSTQSGTSLHLENTYDGKAELTGLVHNLLRADKSYSKNTQGHVFRIGDLKLNNPPYVMSYTIESLGSDIAIRVNDSDKQYHGSIGRYSVVIDTPIDSVGAWCGSNLTISDIQIEKGTTAHPYVEPEYEILSYGEDVLTYPYYDTTRTTSGITFTDLGDRRIKLQGTASETVTFLLLANTKMDKYADYMIKGGISDSIYIQCEDTVSPWSLYAKDTGNGAIINKGVVSVDLAQSIYLRIEKGTVCNNVVIEPKLLKPSKTVITPNTTTAFISTYDNETNIVSPTDVTVNYGITELGTDIVSSIDKDEYASKSGSLVTIDDTNDGYVEVDGLVHNLFDAETVYSKFKQSDGTFDVNISKAYTIHNSLKDFVGEYITISLECKNTNSDTNLRIGTVINGTQTTYAITGTSTSNYVKKSVTIKVFTYNDYWFVDSSQGLVSNFRNFQVVRGTEPKPYVPYSGYEVKSCGKNLFDIQDQIAVTTQSNLIYDDKLLLPYGFYSISFNVTSISGSKIVLNINHKDVKTITSTGNYSYTHNGKITYLQLWSQAASSITNFQVEVGSTATEYEPYQGNSFTVNPNVDVAYVKSYEGQTNVFTDYGIDLNVKYGENVAERECIENKAKIEENYINPNSVVPTTRKINGVPLSHDITFRADDLGASSSIVNGYFDSNNTKTYSLYTDTAYLLSTWNDDSTGNVENGALYLINTGRYGSSGSKIQQVFGQSQASPTLSGLMLTVTSPSYLKCGWSLTKL